MTYCLGIMTRDGLVMTSDCRTNAGQDQVNLTRKMHSFVMPGERVLVLLTSGNLSLAQSVITLLREDFDEGKGLATTGSLYEAARVIGEMVRHVSTLDAASLKADNMKFNLNVLLGGQVRGARSGLYIIYPQGNPLRATKDSCFLQIGECKYGKPILDRGISYDQTTLDIAVKYSVLSMDATIRSNATVGLPIDMLVYSNDEFTITRQRRFQENDPDLVAVHAEWEQSLRKAVTHLPSIKVDNSEPAYYVQQPKSGSVQPALDLKS